jgi:hypothetical protein
MGFFVILWHQLKGDEGWGGTDAIEIFVYLLLLTGVVVWMLI